MIFTFASGTASTAPFLCAASAAGAAASAAARAISGIRRFIGATLCLTGRRARRYWARSATVLFSMWSMIPGQIEPVFS